MAKQDEDSPAQIKKYMKHLRKVLSLPSGYDIADCTDSKTFLSIDSWFPQIKLRGTNDVVIVREGNVRNQALPQNAEVLIELKNPKNGVKMISYEPQTIMEHMAASLLNTEAGVLTILTDLVDKWIFYWFDHTGNSTLKLIASRKEAQFLLDSMFRKTDKRRKLPQDFLERGNMDTILKRLVVEHHDKDANDEEDKNQPPRKKRRKGGSTGGCHSVAQFMDFVDSDLGDEFRTEDDVEERMQIARRFAAQYVLPNMVAPPDRSTLESTGVDVPHVVYLQNP